MVRLTPQARGLGGWADILQGGVSDLFGVGTDWLRQEVADDAPAAAAPVTYVLPPGYTMGPQGPVPTGGASPAAGGINWLLIGGLALGAWFLFFRK